jgi:hypothetical protein
MNPVISMTQRKIRTKKKDKLRLILLIGVICVFLLWLIIPIGTIWYFGKPDSAGAFGDTFGIFVPSGLPT